MTKVTFNDLTNSYQFLKIKYVYLFITVYQTLKQELIKTISTANNFIK